MKDQLERLQAQVAAMQQQHNRLVLQLQRQEAKLRQLEGHHQLSLLNKSHPSMHPTSAPHSQKPAWDQLLLVRDGSGSVELLGPHGQTTPVLDG